MNNAELHIEIREKIKEILLAKNPGLLPDELEAEVSKIGYGKEIFRAAEAMVLNPPKPMTDIYKKRTEEFKDRFVTKHYEEAYENKPVESPWNGDKTGYFDENFVIPTAVLAFHQASMEAVAREIINEIPDELRNTAYPDDDDETLDLTPLKAQLSAKHLKGE